MTIIDATEVVVASATSDITDFYFMATTGVLVPGANYAISRLAIRAVKFVSFSRLFT